MIIHDHTDNHSNESTDDHDDDDANMNYSNFLETAAPINVSACLVVLKHKADGLVEGCIHRSCLN